MGSFAFTCAVSGLPIEAGDKVRYCLVVEGPYPEEHKHAIHDAWMPRVWPLRAEYNDYGGVENVEEGAAKEAWLDAWKIDGVVKGDGENQSHDPATPRNMSWETMLEAVWEHRLAVRRIPGFASLDSVIKFPERPGRWSLLWKRAKAAIVAHWNRTVAEWKGVEPKATARHSWERKKKVPKGVPTLRRIREALIAAGLSDNEFLVNRQGHGRYRVRVAGYSGDSHKLKDAQKALTAFATMITRGAGSYSFGEEMLVRPHPSVTDYHYFSRSRREKNFFQVEQMMIREDVWQALVQIPLVGDYWSPKMTLESTRASVEESWKQLVTPPPEMTEEELKDPEALMKMWKRNDAIRDARREDMTFKDVHHYLVGLSTSFKLVAQRYRQKKMREEEVKPFLDNVSEFIYLHYVLGMTRHLWRPSASAGPQFGEWGMHAMLSKAIADVAKARFDEKHEDDEDEIEEDELEEVGEDAATAK